MEHEVSENHEIPISSRMMPRDILIWSRKEPDELLADTVYAVGREGIQICSGGLCVCLTPAEWVNIAYNHR